MVLRRGASEGRDFGNWEMSVHRAFHHRVTEKDKARGNNKLEGLLFKKNFSVSL
jgi:hypothetical protein